MKQLINEFKIALGFAGDGKNKKSRKAILEVNRQFLEKADKVIEADERTLRKLELIDSITKTVSMVYNAVLEQNEARFQKAQAELENEYKSEKANLLFGTETKTETHRDGGCSYADFLKPKERTCFNYKIKECGCSFYTKLFDSEKTLNVECEQCKLKRITQEAKEAKNQNDLDYAKAIIGATEITSLCFSISECKVSWTSNNRFHPNGITFDNYETAQKFYNYIYNNNHLR